MTHFRSRSRIRSLRTLARCALASAGLALAFASSACGQGPTESNDLAHNESALAESARPESALSLSGGAGGIGGIGGIVIQRPKPIALMKPSTGAVAFSGSGPHLNYYGGPTLPHTDVFAVYWGASVNYQSHINAFYQTIVQSPYFDWLLEYDPSATQLIDRGTFGGAFTDWTPPRETSITDAQIQTELANMLTAGTLPPNGPNNLYMVHFPPGVSITAPDGSQSCVEFCAYHGTFTRGGMNVYYGVLPDLGGACASGCGSNSATQDNVTQVASHELIESVTDSAVGLATSNNAYPLAWYDPTYGEIGDICNGQPATVSGFVVQKGWSNLNNACIASPQGGGANGVATPGDFDGDGKADIAVKSNVTGVWFIDFSANGFGAWDAQHAAYGGSWSVPAVADYDGDGKADLSVKGNNDGVWYIDYASNGFGAWDAEYPAYGGSWSTPVPADYDGDGKADLSVKGSNDGIWYIDYARDGFGGWNEEHAGYGTTSTPVPGDYDGDGKADLSVKDAGGTWYIDYARNGFGSWDEIHSGYGNATAIPAPADYDGDRKTDFAIKGNNDGVWYIDYASNGFGSWDAEYPGYGGSWSTAVPADYDGDHRADLSVKDTGGGYDIDYARDGFGAWNFMTDVSVP